MEKNTLRLPNILICGTPGTGKTTLSNILENSLYEVISKELGIFTKLFQHFELSKIINEYKLYDDYDKEFECTIFNEEKIINFLYPFLIKGGVIIDFHSVDFFAKDLIDIIIVTRTDNKILYDRYIERNYNKTKIDNNIDCEIFEEIKNDCLEIYDKNKIFEVYNNEKYQMNLNLEVIFDILKNYKLLDLIKVMNNNN